MIARARAVEPYAWLLAPTAIVVFVQVRLGWVAALLALALAVASGLAAVLAHGAESRRLRAWYDDQLDQADTELDAYDALRHLVAPVVAAHPRSAAARRLQAAWPRFAPTTGDTDDTEEESAVA